MSYRLRSYGSYGVAPDDNRCCLECYQPEDECVCPPPLPEGDADHLADWAARVMAGDIDCPDCGNAITVCECHLSGLEGIDEHLTVTAVDEQAAFHAGDGLDGYDPTLGYTQVERLVSGE